MFQAPASPPSRKKASRPDQASTLDELGIVSFEEAFEHNETLCCPVVVGSGREYCR